MIYKIVILASGDGSLTQAILDAVANTDLAVSIAAVICDQPGAHVLYRAQQASVPTIVHPLGAHRQSWNDQLMEIVTTFSPDLVVSAGFMRILSPEFVARSRVINSHPSLLPAFPGAHAVGDALGAGVKTTGATIHWVDAGMDTGTVIAQRQVDIEKDDDESSLHERIKIVERTLIVSTINEIVHKNEESNA